MFSTLRREFRAGGRPYRLAQAREVIGQVARLDDARAHVRLVADVGNTRQRSINGGVTLTGLGAAASGIGLVLNVMVPVALIPTALGLASGWALVRRRISQLEQVHVALEQVLDRLEHGDIVLPSDRPSGPRPSAFVRIAEEIRRSLGT
jgi:hypothetical protein